MCCSEDAKIIFEVIKVFYNFLKFILPILLIVIVTFDFFKMIITKKEEDTKKIKSLIIQRVISCVIIFLVPTFVFFTFRTLFNKEIIDVNELRSCWNLE